MPKSTGVHNSSLVRDLRVNPELSTTTAKHFDALIDALGSAPVLIELF